MHVPKEILDLTQYNVLGSVKKKYPNGKLTPC